jgi:DNA polymerase V
MPATFGLIDGNSFYCSCERALAPRLRGKALVVLSNNDGCAIARTSEAKAAGVKMGDPWHLAKDRPAVREAKVEWLSSNYPLYGDMSRRMYQVLAARVPRVEPYSIDEMFLDLDVPGDPVALARELREAVRRIAKIPTCVGIGPTKTIAKLGNRLAKDDPKLDGVFDLRDEETRQRVYERTPIGEVWGIGRKTVEKLKARGIDTIARFLAMPQRDARDLLTVVGGRVQMELRGVSCVQLSMMAPPRKGIAVTRSFGKAVTTWPELREASAWHATRAGEKLRSEELVAARMSVFLHTNPFNGDPWYSAQHGGRIEPTSDTAALIAEARRMLQPLWRQGFRYAKAGLMLDDLRDGATEPATLFPTRDPAHSKKVMAVLDAVNHRYGRGALRPLATGISRSWTMRQARLTPRYTTHAAEMMEVRTL